MSLRRLLLLLLFAVLLQSLQSLCKAVSSEGRVPDFGHAYLGLIVPLELTTRCQGTVSLLYRASG